MDFYVYLMRYDHSFCSNTKLRFFHIFHSLYLITKIESFYINYDNSNIICILLQNEYATMVIYKYINSHARIYEYTQLSYKLKTHQWRENMF